VSGHEFGGLELRFLEGLKKHNTFRVTAAYLGIAWLIVHVATVIGETFAPIHHVMPWLIYALAIGLPMVLIGSWLSQRRRTAPSVPGISARRLDTLIIVVLALAIVALAVDRWLRHRPASESMIALLGIMVVVLLFDRVIVRRRSGAAVANGAAPRVAILPFVDMSAEKDQDYFCEGTAEEIINALCGVSGLRVASRSASFQLKNRAVDAHEVGRLLNVGSFLEGSVRKAGDRMRITAQLINVKDGFHHWSQTFDRRVEDIFAVQGCRDRGHGDRRRGSEPARD
jgi:TolB-like protein